MVNQLQLLHPYCAFPFLHSMHSRNTTYSYNRFTVGFNAVHYSTFSSTFVRSTMFPTAVENSYFSVSVCTTFTPHIKGKSVHICITYIYSTGSGMLKRYVTGSVKMGLMAFLVTFIWQSITRFVSVVLTSNLVTLFS